MSSCTPVVHRAHNLRRSGLTIVEMMVSLVAVVLLMLAYTQLFSDVGSRISDARSMIELTNRMHSATGRLRMDLAGHTCELLPWRDPSAGQGYVEIIEGPLSDQKTGYPDDSLTPLPINEMYFLGDTDDMLMFTVRSKEGPFIGRYAIDQNNDNMIQANEVVTVQSEVAEVVWFLRPTLQRNPSGDPTPLPATPSTTPPQTFTLYRRAFLVMPTYQGNPVQVAQATYAGDEHQFDISLRREGSNYVANTLGDLTKRESRFAHDPAGFPFRVDHQKIVPFGHHIHTTGGGDYELEPDTSEVPSFVRFGEDVVLSNVVAFDVQVWDPTAPIYTVGNPPIAVGPGDPGYPTSGTAASSGAYVDLGWSGQPYSAFPTSPFRTTGRNETPNTTANIQMVATGNGNAPNLYDTWLFKPNIRPATYDTWSSHYEHDGLDQDGVGGADQGTDGFDTGGQAGVVDDANERETSPPYPVPLRGIKVRIRCYEPDSRQVHEVSVVESFVPQ